MKTELSPPLPLFGAASDGDQLAAVLQSPPGPPCQVEVTVSANAKGATRRNAPLTKGTVREWRTGRVVAKRCVRSMAGMGDPGSGLRRCKPLVAGEFFNPGVTWNRAEFPSLNHVREIRLVR